MGLSSGHRKSLATQTPVLHGCCPGPRWLGLGGRPCGQCPAPTRLLCGVGALAPRQVSTFVRGGSPSWPQRNSIKGQVCFGALWFPTPRVEPQGRRLPHGGWRRGGPGSLCSPGHVQPQGPGCHRHRPAVGPGLGLWWSLLWGWGQPAARVTGLSLGQAQTEPQVWRSCWLPRVATARRGCRFWGWHGLPQVLAFNEVVPDQARGYRQAGHTGEGSRPRATLHPERCEVQPFHPARKCKPCFGSQGVGAPPDVRSFSPMGSCPSVTSDLGCGLGHCWTPARSASPSDFSCSFLSAFPRPAFREELT